ncbi:MAG: hypothetical protein RL235_106 [Chlamydiota bacterium]|jgi:hypothetical protein
MKAFQYILVMGAVALSPMLSEQVSLTKIQQEESVRQGTVAITAIRQAYLAGEYDEFLKEADRAYMHAKEKNELTALIDLRNADAVDSEWAINAQKLMQEKNRLLMELVADKDDAFSQKVQSAARSTVTEEQNQALRSLAELRLKKPGSGQTSEENQLIDLDLEYEFKALRVDLPGTPSVKEPRELQIVLRMEKMDKMIQMAKSFQDANWQHTVTLAAERFDERLAGLWDADDLNRMVTGRLEARTEVEKNAVSILKAYQEQLQNAPRS